MDKKKKYMLTAGSIYVVGIIGICLLKAYAGLIIIIPGAAYTFYKLYNV